MKFLLDTNIILIYLRDQKTKAFIDEHYNPFGTANIPVISVVSIGEINSLAHRNNWGEKRKKAVEKFYRKCVITDINAKDVLVRYGEIDAFSQGKLSAKPLGTTARNMGKNDLWIASTASVTNAKLMTTDKDFSHLDGQFLELVLIELVR
ncbi:MAG: PIN domain-containing protein [Bacteroidota bacterium]